MDTTSLKYFLAVAEHRNFTKAAEHLYITQSALSRNIAELEAELGTKLFLRTTRSVSLSPTGEILRKSARDLILRLDQIQTDIKKTDAGLSGELVVGYIVTPFFDVLLPAVLRFQEKYPEIKVRYISNNEGPLMSAYSRDELDLVIFGSFDVAALKDVEVKNLFADSIGLVVRPDHPLASAEIIDYKMLADKQFVLLSEDESPNFNRLLEKVCTARGFSLSKVTRVESIDAVSIEIKADNAIGIMTRSCHRHYAQDLIFLEFEGDDTKFFLSIAWHKYGCNPIVPLLLSTLDEHLANLAE